MFRHDAVTLKQLRALAAVADAGSLTLAATRLGLTVPAVHAQLAGLESAACGPLIDRAAGFTLTAEGRALALAGRRVNAALARAGDEIDALRRGETGQVTIGFVSTGKYFAPRLVRALMDANPRAHIALRIGNRAETIEGLASGALDIAVTGRPPRQPLVEAVPLGPHPHGIVLPPDHPLARRGDVTAAELAAQTFLAREPGSGTRILMTRWLDQMAEGHSFRLVEMDSNETIKQAVIAGLGIAFLSLHTVADELHAGRLAQLSARNLPIERTWFLVHLASQPLSPLVARVADTLVAEVGRHLPQIPPA